MVHRVSELMSAEVWTCHASHPMSRAAELMWNHDCGAVPVVEDSGELVGIVTDRDLCMAAYTRGQALHDMPLRSLCERELVTCVPDDSIAEAERKMVRFQVRRLPVIDGERRVVGMLTLSDLVRHLAIVSPEDGGGFSPRSLALTLEAVSRPRSAPGEAEIVARQSDALAKRS
ncbi:MAG: CBS domain-containing protein [Polyangiaceae bacterium]|jgi:CBS domain-containing protein|nr:CBS domain-containing protein [Polyangiaceae bacterium]MBK8942142.1 CBS domain-containing protein [Polyangiaceae bacterium]